MTLPFNKYSLSVSFYLHEFFTSKTLVRLSQTNHSFSNKDLVNKISIPVKGICLSKALACMKIFLYKQECFFVEETESFGHIVV